MDLFAMMPYIGGRGSSGDGKVMLVYENKPSSDLYLEFLAEKRDEIRELLQELEAKL